MVGISKKTHEERREKEERDRQYRKEYNARPVVRKRKKEYYKKYVTMPHTKEAHRQAQERYRWSEKGRECIARYWKKKNSGTKQIKKDSGISVNLD